MRPEEQLEILKRGAAEIINEDELKGKLERSRREGKPLLVKLGLDPSAPDIHLGHAVVLRKMKQFQDLGHHVVLVVGDFTGRIGDPTGRSETRRQLSPRQVEENARTYQEQAFKILDPEKTRIVFNSEWLAPLRFEEIIRMASTYTVARMLEREEFRERFQDNRPIFIHEFFYPFMQGYDSVALRADVELGATEQKFNILMGRHLQKEYGQEPQVAMLMPILVGIDGKHKMSKSLGNYIGVAESPDQIYGKVMSIPDEVMKDYYELASGLPEREVEEIIAGLASGQIHPRDAKRRLAREITALYHGHASALMAEKQFDLVFRQGDIPDDIPEVKIPERELVSGRIGAARLLAMAGLVSSNSEGRRMIAQGAVTVGARKLDDPLEEVEVTDGLLLRVGKRRFARVAVSR
ncbi:MAG TPA: tyrosine--tRNA ligase [Firmicutes bacterium]|nr:tyrosine--tRNA ligase [Bacillota bacterium]